MGGGGGGLWEGGDISPLLQAIPKIMQNWRCCLGCEEDTIEHFRFNFKSIQLRVLALRLWSNQVKKERIEGTSWEFCLWSYCSWQDTT